MIYKRPMIAVGQPSLVVSLDKFTSANSFVNTLSSRQLIKSPDLFLLFIRLYGVSQSLKAGIYVVKPGDSAWQFLQQVVRGEVLVLPFQIIDGTTINEVTKAAKKAPYLKFSDADWQKIQDPHSSAEGLLLADTYHYDAGSEALALLMRAHTRLEEHLNSAWSQRDSSLPYKSAYELLIVASIIEKEAAIATEKRIISGVIVNRLQKKMRLQMDPTVIYGLQGNYNGQLSHKDLLVDSPYNTYRRRGLPPTPIAMVGKDAIDAAAHPLLSKNLYYVAKGDGSHEFSTTYEQQRVAIKKYLRNGK